MSTAIVTDSNCGITPAEARELGIFVVPMPFFIDGELFYEGINLSQAEFFRRMGSGADITTSQPTPGDVLNKWDEALEAHGELVYIPMSSSLSGECATARMLAEDYDGRVVVADNLRISAEDELDEATRIYPEFAATAKKEGFPEIAALYENIIQVETCHHKLFSQLYEQMKNGTMYKKKEKVKWKCADCGYEATSKEAWQECPLCKAKQGSVMIMIED